MRTKSSENFQTLLQRAGMSIREAALYLDISERQVRRYVSGESSPPASTIRVLNIEAALHRKTLSQSDPGFKFIDLFAGIGGLRIPFEEIGGRCIFTSEWDRFARETYASNFHEEAGHEFAGDIRPYANEPWRIPAHDVLLAGFPCQPFSIAGVSKKNSLGRPHGFLCDTQGTLFYDLARIIEYHRPPVFLLENVKNLERHDGGKTFSTIMHVLGNELGYNVFKRIVSSDPWVPQKRERIFLIGFKHPARFNFENLEIPKKGPTLGDILEPEVDAKYTLTPTLWNYLKDYKEKHNSAGNGFGYSLFGPEDVTRTLSARYYKDGSEILVRQKGNRPRRLTPRECARLMGFDSLRGSKFKIPVSDTQAYRQFGNAVVVPVVRAIASLLKPHLFQALATEAARSAQNGRSQVKKSA